MQLAQRVLQPVLDPVERLTDALADPARRERTVVAALAVYAAIWTLYGVISKAAQDIQFDAAELAVWSRHPALGYAKHPPLAAWLEHAWFAVMPMKEWSVYLLAMSYAALGLWVAWRLFGRFLDADKRIVALACLMLLPYFNFFALRFDHNAVLGLLWAATALFYIRSYDTRAPRWAALAGIAAAAAMLGKYWSIFLLAGLGLAALTDARRTSYFRSSAPWITLAAGTLALTPHLVWLVQHDFIPLTYAMDAHVTKTFTDVLFYTGRYLAGGAGYAAVPVVFVLALCRPSRAALADLLLPREPRRRFVAVTFWTTLLVPALAGVAFAFELDPIWTLPDLILLPLLLLSSPLLTLRRQATVAIVAVAVVLPPVLLAASPVIVLLSRASTRRPRMVKSWPGGSNRLGARLPIVPCASSAAILTCRIRCRSICPAGRTPIRCWSRKPRPG